MQTLTEQLQTIPIGELHPHPDNANRGDLQAIRESIETNGFYGAIVVQKSTGFILSGNHRYEAAKSLGATHLPVITVEVTDQQARKILLADNRTTRLGDDDPEALTRLLQQILAGEDGLSGTGFTDEDLQTLLESINASPTDLTPPPEEHNYKEQYGVIVVCDDEKHQEETYNKLREQGFNCKVVVT
jgi:ParB-like chromosome segregation protein Spo0J